MSETTKFDPAVVESRSVIEPPPDFGKSIPGTGDFTTLWLVTQFANEIIPWGRSPKQRDNQLRNFIPLEHTFASALGIICSRNSGFQWQVEGPPRTVSYLQDMLENANEGKGWHDLIVKTTIDLSTQDNGAFWELVRRQDSKDSPVIGINHLDSARCWHTGHWQTPVVYKDWKGRIHLLKWYNVIEFADMPAAIENVGMYGMQYSSLTRMLMKMQTRRNINLYDYEKTAGRATKAIHLVKGITTQQLKDSMTSARATADSSGLQVYADPVVIGTISPEADVGHDTILLVDVPTGWTPEIDYNQYINLIAMAFMTDYQEFAPLPGQRLGTGAQSEVLHLKSRGKGPGTFMNIISRALNFKVIPRNAHFFFDEQDLEADKAKAEVKALRAQTRAVRIKSGEITPQVARQIANDEGDLSLEMLQLMADQDVTPDVTTEGDDVFDPSQNVAPGVPGPDVPPGGGGSPNLRGQGGRPPAAPSANPPAPLGTHLRPNASSKSIVDGEEIPDQALEILHNTLGVILEKSKEIDDARAELLAEAIEVDKQRIENAHQKELNELRPMRTIRKVNRDLDGRIIETDTTEIPVDA